MSHHRFALAVPILACALLAPIALAQDKPPQPHIAPISEPFQHTADPAFAYAIPKKKKQFEPILARWRQVDLSARKDEAIRDVTAALEAEEQKEPKDEQRIIELRSRKAEIERFYQRTKLLLEVDGDPEEFVRIEVQTIGERSIQISKANPRGYIETRWSKVQILKDEETTSKADKKKNRQSHLLQLYGTPENAQTHQYWRIETRLIPTKEGNQLHQLTFIHAMPRSRHDKESDKEDQLLAMCLLVP